MASFLSSPGIIWTTGLAISVALLFKAIQSIRRYYSVHKALQSWPSQPYHWFLGHLHLVRETIKNPQRVIELSKETPKQFMYGIVLYIGPAITYLKVHHHKIFRSILGGSEKHCPKSDTSYRPLLPWLGKGLLILRGKEWHVHRRLLTNSFHWNILQPYAQKMNACSLTMMKKWKKKEDGKSCISVEFFEEISLMTIDSLMQCLFGNETNCQISNDEHQSYISCIYKLSNMILNRLRNQNLLMKIDKIYHMSPTGRDFLKNCGQARQYAEKIIEKRRAEVNNGISDERDLGFDQKNQRKLDFLDVLLQAKDDSGNHLSDEEISDEVNTFLFEGHDTTTSAICWMCYCMAKYSDHQQKCYTEIAGLMGDKNSIEWEDLSKLEYLTLCIKEALRMFPPVPTIVRKPTVDIEVDGKLIKKDTEVLVSILSLHYNPHIWDSPDNFDPLRFTPEKSKGRDPFAYVPFSAGVRNCIGQNFAMNEIKICVAHILKNYKLDIDESKPLVHCAELIYRTQGGMYLLITPR